MFDPYTPNSEVTTTTTPSGIVSQCQHRNHRSHEDIHRHEQVTDGVTRVYFEATPHIFCMDCGYEFKFTGRYRLTDNKELPLIFEIG